MTHTMLLIPTETKTATTSTITPAHKPEALAKKDFAKLYELYFSLVHRICYRYTKNREEADDLAQEVFVKVHASFATFEGNAQPSTWLYRVATNHCLDHLRWKKRQTELLSGYGEDLHMRPAPENTVDNPVRRLLRRMMENMDEANRQVVFLRFEVGLTHEEIAEICGVSRVAITKRLAKFLTTVVDLKADLTDSFQTDCCENRSTNSNTEENSEAD